MAYLAFSDISKTKLNSFYRPKNARCLVSTFPVGNILIVVDLRINGSECSANLVRSTSTLKQLGFVRRL